jgi:tRNA threonylcarbamoyl adenosine modification protein YjeE
MKPLDIPLPDHNATRDLAARIAPLLRKGDMLALSGELGAGKTEFARALLHARGIVDDVPSPTFTLVQAYETGGETGGLTISHFDLYRLKSAAELDELGWDDAQACGAVIVEWPERASARLPADRLELKFTLEANGQRHCTVTPYGNWSGRL